MPMNGWAYNSKMASGVQVRLTFGSNVENIFEQDVHLKNFYNHCYGARKHPKTSCIQVFKKKINLFTSTFNTVGSYNLFCNQRAET